MSINFFKEKPNNESKKSTNPNSEIKVLKALSLLGIEDKDVKICKISDNVYMINEDLYLISKDNNQITML